MKLSPFTRSAKFCATLWSMEGWPSPRHESTIPKKMEAIAAAGFDGVHDLLSPEHLAVAQSLGLTVIGRLDGRKPTGWKASVRRQTDAGVTLINIHLGLHNTPPATAAQMTAEMVQYGRTHGAHLQVETHRATATETPEKYDQIRATYTKLTSEPLPTTWDHSHFAVMKHLTPEEYAPRLLAWPREIQASRLFHCRPFNGQHTQIPVTNGRSRLSPEFLEYAKFAHALFRLWHQGPADPLPLWICPELGPVGSYHLSTNPPGWADTVRCLKELKKIWKQTELFRNSKTNP